MRHAILAAFALAAPALALAQDGDHGHACHGAAPSAASETPAIAALREVNARMHREMEVHYTGDVDVDFVRSIIPPPPGRHRHGEDRPPALPGARNPQGWPRR